LFREKKDSLRHFWISIEVRYNLSQLNDPIEHVSAKAKVLLNKVDVACEQALKLRVYRIESLHR
jgi:uncharacterized protein YfaA (DUF2138 family)